MFNIKKQTYSTSPILISGDVTRIELLFRGPGQIAIRHNQTSNIRFLHAITRTAILQAFGQEAKVHLPSDSDAQKLEMALEQEATDRAAERPVERTYGMYVRNYENSDDRLLEKLLADASVARLVVGFEFSPSIIRTLEEKQIAYLNFRWGPLRFLNDLTIQARSNRPALIEAIKYCGLNQSDIDNSIDFVRASASRHPIIPSWIPDGTIVVAGQTWGDSALIKDCKLHHFGDFSEKIIAATQNAPFAIIVPHPYQQDNLEIEKKLLQQLQCEAMISRINPYVLLSDSRVRSVIALSSSLTVEARCFGKEATTLLQNSKSSEDGSDIHTLTIRGNAIRSPDFWRTVSAALDGKKFKGAQAAINETPSLRDALGWDWAMGSLVQPGSLKIAPRILALRNIKSEGIQFVKDVFRLALDEDYDEALHSSWHVSHLQKAGRESLIEHILSSNKAKMLGSTSI